MEKHNDKKSSADAWRDALVVIVFIIILALVIALAAIPFLVVKTMTGIVCTIVAVVLLAYFSSRILWRVCGMCTEYLILNLFIAYLLVFVIHFLSIPFQQLRDIFLTHVLATEKIDMPDGRTKVVAVKCCWSKDVAEITLPAEVTEIGEQAFYGNRKLVTVNFPSGVTAVGREAFAECTGLTDIVLPYGVREIGYRAFGGCTSLARVTIPDSVTEISPGAFARCRKLTDVRISDAALKKFGELALGTAFDSECPAFQKIKERFTAMKESAMSGNVLPMHPGWERFTAMKESAMRPVDWDNAGIAGPYLPPYPPYRTDLAGLLRNRPSNIPAFTKEYLAERKKAMEKRFAKDIVGKTWEDTAGKTFEPPHSPKSPDETQILFGGDSPIASREKKLGIDGRPEECRKFEKAVFAVAQKRLRNFILLPGADVLSRNAVLKVAAQPGKDVNTGLVLPLTMGKFRRGPGHTYGAPQLGYSFVYSTPCAALKSPHTEITIYIYESQSFMVRSGRPQEFDLSRIAFLELPVDFDALSRIYDALKGNGSMSSGGGISINYRTGICRISKSSGRKDGFFATWHLDAAQTKLMQSGVTFRLFNSELPRDFPAESSSVVLLKNSKVIRLRIVSINLSRKEHQTAVADFLQALDRQLSQIEGDGKYQFTPEILNQAEELYRTPPNVLSSDNYCSPSR